MSDYERKMQKKYAMLSLIVLTILVVLLCLLGCDDHKPTQEAVNRCNEQGLDARLERITGANYVVICQQFPQTKDPINVHQNTN